MTHTQDAYDVRDSDLAQTRWEVVASPVDRKAGLAYSRLLLPPNPVPHDWHEISDGDMNALVCISHGLSGPDANEGSFESIPETIAVVVRPAAAAFAGSAVTATTLRLVPIEAINAGLLARWASKVPQWLTAEAGDLADRPLRRPSDSDSRRFHAHVAIRYLHHLTATANPTKALAEEASNNSSKPVPHPTVQRWVVECRRRGYLPRLAPRKGRAG